ncbi:MULTISPECIES: alpha/beta hydrolase [unclassified Pseudomonas]|uniref:alpha/beta hydrolase n=1 Tax=unclassified Pseudomonas TaxID=196821 RepID=UPI000C88C135|nr:MULTISPECIES: alpha/beta hydrolase [unclassified Pseudomonas]PMZ96338.1 alpha/beta hydrolase [Pseudomonas sp. FW305-42]PNA28321.1 alpha/beta hydrolase [Pseudomonas sp. MPR-R1B]PNB28787.1 alpha/beta hydrolase [Pseudomonas sp. DP16D-E2]PNB45466.1 alpha/beta hydrolase [Pseudomonas sp. FW305-17]PNB64514.1 alpha/beta hydrolase [Pseudomonas sp. GW531-E2]
MKLSHTLTAGLLALAVNSAFAAGSPGVEHTTQGFLDALAAGGGKPLETLAPKDARAVLSGAQAGVKADVSGIRVERRTIQADGQPLEIRVVRPEGSKGELPVFMFFHGGGWVLGDYPTHERLIRDLVVGSGAAAVYVDYTPSPEAKYPTAINQAYAATRWVAEHGKEIGVDGSRLAVAGNSVGGNMAAVVALKAKEAGTPKLRFQALLWPVTDANFNNASYNQFAEGHFLTRNMMQWFWNSYTTDPRQRDDIHASPLRASLEQLKGLPPALVQTAEMDVLRDEGEAYARKLDAAGVPVTAVRYNGMIHDYGLLNVLSTVPSVRSAMDQAAQALKNHLQ